MVDSTGMPLDVRGKALRPDWKPVLDRMHAASHANEPTHLTESRVGSATPQQRPSLSNADRITRNLVAASSGTFLTMPSVYGSYATAVNSSGQVAGYIDDTISLLGVAGTSSSDVVGVAFLQGIQRGVVWVGGAPRRLGLPSGLPANVIAQVSMPNSINAGGQSAGLLYADSVVYDVQSGDPTLQTFALEAVRWDASGTGAVLAPPTSFGASQDSAQDYAYAINSAGDVVGNAYDFNDNRVHCVFWPAGSTTGVDMGAPPSPACYAEGINDAGVVAGWFYGADGLPQSFSWTLGAGFSMLHSDIASDGAYAFGISNGGVVYGTECGTGGCGVVVWPNGAAPVHYSTSSNEYVLNNGSSVAGQSVGALPVNSCSSTLFLSCVGALFQGGDVTLLSPIPESNSALPSFANGANGSYVVGSAYSIQANSYRAAVWTFSLAPQEASTAIPLSIPSGANGFASYIANTGQMLGSVTQSGQPLATLVLWQASGSATNLSALGTSTLAFGGAVSNAGDIVGTGNFPTGPGALWFSQGPQTSGTIVAPPAGYSQSELWSINTSGLAVGSLVDASGARVAAIWQAPRPGTPGVWRPIGSLPGEGTLGTSINDSGVVAGFFIDVGGNVRSFVWSVAGDFATIPLPPGALTLFPSFDVLGFSGGAINSAGTVAVTAGYGMFSSGPYRAFLWSLAKGFTDLGLPTGFTSTKAYSVNDGGVVAGVCTIDMIERACVWTSQRGWQDLGTLPGGSISDAYSINNSGQIVGASDRPGSGGVVPVLWNTGLIGNATAARKPIAFVSLADTTTVGVPASFSALGSASPEGAALTYSWNWGDGTGAGSGAISTHTFTLPGAYAVALTVRDSRGLTATATTSAIVSGSTAVSLALTLPATPITDAAVVALNVHFTDPGAGPYNYTIVWADNTPNTTGSLTTVKNFSANHLYAPGSYELFVQLADGAGATVTQQAPLTILHVAPTATFTAASPLEGATSFPLTLSAVKVGPASVNAGLTEQFDCGQGAGLQSGTVPNPVMSLGSNTMSCLAPFTGTIAVKTTITDAFGGTATYSKNLTVINVAPVVPSLLTSLPSATPILIGSSYSVQGSFTDPGTDGPWIYTLIWGDGTANTTGSAATQGVLPIFNHSYTKAGNFIIKLSVKDKGNATGSATPVPITVVPPAPPAPASVTAGVSGSSIQLTWGAVSGSVSYRVLRSASSGAEALPAIATPSTPGYLDPSATAGATNFYVVEACNAGGCSAPSAEVSAVPLSLPAVPSGLQVFPGAPGGGQISLSWSAVSGASFYQLSVATSSGGPYTLLNAPQTTTTPGFTDIETSGSSYFYVVQACNAATVCSAKSPKVPALAP
jgi:PKD repeat protein